MVFLNIKGSEEKREFWKAKMDGMQLGKLEAAVRGQRAGETWGSAPDGQLSHGSMGTVGAIVPAKLCADRSDS